MLLLGAVRAGGQTEPQRRPSRPPHRGDQHLRTSHTTDSGEPVRSPAYSVVHLPRRHLTHPTAQAKPTHRSVRLLLRVPALLRVPKHLLVRACSVPRQPTLALVALHLLGLPRLPSCECAWPLPMLQMGRCALGASALSPAFVRQGSALLARRRLRVRRDGGAARALTAAPPPRVVRLPRGSVTIGTDQPHFKEDAEGPARAWTRSRGARRRAATRG